MAGDQFEVERKGRIAAPPATVHALLDDFRQWQKWSPWEDIDPNQERTFSGPDSGVGAVYEWKGNRKVGQGRMEILESEPDKVVLRLDFIKPMKTTNTTTFELTPAGAGTQVTWRMVGPRTLFTKIFGIFKSMDDMVGPDFEKGLASLRQAAEA